MTSQTSSTKRPRDSESYTESDITTSASASPPAAKRLTRSQPTPTDTQAPDHIRDDARSSQADEWSTPYDFEDTILHSSFLAAIKIYHRKLTVPFERYMLEALSLYIRIGNPAKVNKCINAINKWFASYSEAGSASEDDPFAMLQEEWEALRDDELYKPLAPSSFARSSQWVHQQNGRACINCLRPPECTGLPLNVLHPLFAEFLALTEGPPPDSSNPKFILAEQVATELCQEMPRHFDTEGDRLETFYRIISHLFGKKGILSRQVAVGSGRVDFALQFYEVGLVLVGEGKDEPGGNSGDPYMQVAASYDAWAREVEEKSRIDTGCPCFVCCVDGPNILFGGGFRDEVSVVEPLSGWCIMMPHMQLKREQILARHLYALSFCLSDPSKFLEPLPSRTARCPRVYGAFIRSDSRESVPLKFTKPFTNPWHRRHGVFDLLFCASVEEKIGNDLPAKESSVLVKVPIGSTYGLEPHVLAASARFAPRLLGTASVPGAPVIYVMELLSKSEGWFHLVKAELPKQFTEQHKEHLRKQGTALISFLLQHQLVHGDLRGCNVMCHLGDNDVDLRVLDWDWAGKQGAARYPAALNIEAGYKGLPGELIEASHDEAMFRKTLDDFFAS